MISEGCTAKLRRDHTQLHRGLCFLLFAMSICFILIHRDERQSSHIAWLHLHWSCAWPTFGKIPYFGWWLLAVWADCGWDAQNGSVRAVSLLSWGSSTAPSTSQPSAPTFGASARPGSIWGYFTSYSSGHTVPEGQVFNSCPRALFLIHNEDCLRFPTFNATFRQAAAAWQ